MKKILLLLVTFFIITGFSNDTKDYVNEGFKAFKAKKYQQAISLYNRALVINPKNVKALNGKGVTLAFSGKPKEGLKYIYQAIKAKPDYWTAYFNAGLANELAGNYTAAVQAYQKVIGYDPKNTWSYYGIACAYGSMGDAENAVRYLKVAVKLDKSVKNKARTEKDFNKIRKNKKFLEVVK